MTLVTVTPCHKCDMAGTLHPSVRASVPTRIRKALTHHNCCVFVSTRPFRKRKTKTDNEFLDHWVRRTFLVTEHGFPSTKRRSPVVTRLEVEANPLEGAGRGVALKTMELQEMIRTNEKVPDGGASQSFTMMLGGVVDAAVSGGVKNFEPFLTGECVHVHVLSCRPRRRLCCDLTLPVPPLHCIALQQLCRDTPRDRGRLATSSGEGAAAGRTDQGAGRANQCGA